MELLKKLLALVNDSHVAFALVIFGTGSTMQWFHRLDPNYIAFCGTVIGFVLGHAVWGQTGDK